MSPTRAVAPPPARANYDEEPPVVWPYDSAGRRSRERREAALAVERAEREKATRMREAELESDALMDIEAAERRKDEADDFIARDKRLRRYENDADDGEISDDAPDLPQTTLLFSDYWDRVEKRHVAEIERREKDRLEKETCLPRFEEWMKRRKMRGIDAKHAIVDKIRANLAAFDRGGSYRSQGQIALHEMFLASSARYIYTKELFDRYQVEIMRRNEWTVTDVHQCFACQTPRRWGKTWAVALFVAALVCALPNAEVCIFSPTERQSILLLDKVKVFVEDKWPGFKYEKNTANKLWIQASRKDVRKITAFASSVDVSCNRPPSSRRRRSSSTDTTEARWK